MLVLFQVLDHFMAVDVWNHVPLFAYIAHHESFYAHVFSAVDQLLNRLKDEIRLPLDFAVWIKEVVKIRLIIPSSIVFPNMCLSYCG